MRKGGGCNVAISVFKNAHYTSLSKQLLRARARAHTRLAALQECAPKACMWPYWRLLREDGAADACNGATADTAAGLAADFKGALWPKCNTAAQHNQGKMSGPPRP